MHDLIGQKPMFYHKTWKKRVLLFFYISLNLCSQMHVMFYHNVIYRLGFFSC